MSVAAVAWALDQPVNPPARKLVLVKLAERADAEGKCWPSIESLCESVGLKDRMVRYHLKALTTDGFMASENRGRQTNLFILNLSGNPLPIAKAVIRQSVAGKERNALPVNESDNRQSIAPISEGLTGNGMHFNRQPIAATSLLNHQEPSEKTKPPRPRADTDARASPDWLKRLSTGAWARLTPLHIAELEAQATRLGLDIAAESLACEDYWKGHRKEIKSPFTALKNWLDKAAEIKGERNGNGRANSQKGDSNTGADDGGFGGWAEVIANRGRRPA